MSSATVTTPPGFSDSKEFKITLYTNTIKLPPLADVSAFLHYFNRLYEISRLATDPSYRKVKLEDRSHMKSLLNVEDRLRVQQLILTSPLQLEALLNAAPFVIASIWGLILVVEKAVNIKKTLEEFRKLKKENSKETDIQDIESYVRYAKRFVSRSLMKEELMDEYKYASENLMKVTIKLTQVDIEVIDKNREAK